MKKMREHRDNRDRRSNPMWKLGVPLALLLGLPWTASAAPDPSTLNIKGMPDSGRILNELEPERRITPQQAKPEIDTKIPAVQQDSKELAARIDRIDYICSELDVGSVLKDEMQPYLGREMDFQEMQALAAKVTASLRHKGYMTAVAYVPA
ncbi:POTRA domain-containing protein [Mitsuokella jalaludinii]